MFRLRTLILTMIVAAAFYPAAFSTSAGPGRGLPPAVAPRPQPEDSVHLTLGNPSRATRSTSTTTNFLVVKPQFALSYNRDNGGPNWVSWHVGRSDLGRGRTGDFAPDQDLPEGWRIRPADYTGSGYDRGHLCPSADRNSNLGDNQATFVMSNMLPQRPHLNRNVWRKLEEFSRDLVRARRPRNELYVIAGGYDTQGRIGRGKVNVPRRNWKVIVVLPEGDDDLSRIDENTRVIAVDMPNVQGISGDPWTKYITTVDDIERKTGYDFLSNVPASIQDVIEAKEDSSGRRVERRARRGVRSRPR